MAKVGLLRYPTEWEGAINCSPLMYGGPTHRSQNEVCAHALQNCYWHSQQPVQVCVCHGFCSSHCSPPFAPENQNWKNILAPYINVAADGLWSAQVLSDCSRKLSALDPEKGFGVLHGLLVSNNDAALFEWFLELGVDVDMPFIDSDTNNYAGLPNFDIATAKKLNCATAAHFAAFFGRDECLQLLVDVGANFDVKTEDGEKPLDLAKDETAKIIQDTVARGAKTLAQLAKEKKYFAVRYRMRSGRVTTADLRVQYDGKTAVEWIWTRMTEWQFAMRMDQDSLMAFKIMSEMRHRYNIAGTNLGDPPVFSVPAGRASTELTDEVRKVGESLQTILESICVLSGEVKKLKTSEKRVVDGGSSEAPLARSFNDRRGNPICWPTLPPEMLKK